MEFNLADLVESVVDIHPDRVALVSGDVRLTYRDLDERANRVAHCLLEAGIPEQGNVGLQLQNGHEYAEAMLGILKARMVPVNVNYRYVTEELRYLYRDARLAGLIVGAEFAERAADVADDAPGLRRVLVVADGSTPQVPASWSDYEQALAAASPQRDFAGRSGDDLFIIYTGGTTGMPKGVMWRQEDMFFAGLGGGAVGGAPAQTPQDIPDWAAAKGELRMFPVAPLMHGAAQFATFIAWLQGGTILLLPRFSAAGVLDLVERERSNTLMIVGDAMARPIAEELQRRVDAGTPPDLSSLFAVSSAGAILSQGVKDLLVANLPNILVMDSYGASETGFNGSAAPGSSPDAGLRFSVNDRTAVLGDDLRPVRPGSGEIGRIAQKGRIPVGYFGDAVKTAETFPTVDGVRWVVLGDLARVEEDGTISLLGRASACINSGGEKIYPDEVEAGLKAHPAVFDAVVAGRKDERFGEVVAAAVQIRPGYPEPTLADLQAHLASRVARYKVPRHVVIVASVQRSPSGKPDYPWAKRTVNA